MRKKYILCTLVFVVAFFSVSAQAQSAQRALLARVFALSGFIPIEVSRNQSVGDVYRLPDLGLVSTQKECFPGLKIETTPDQLGSINIGTDVDLAAGLGVGDILSANGDVGSIAHLEMSFDDVEIARASEVGLRTHLARGTCPELGFLVKSSLAVETRPPMIVGEVFTARKRIRIVFRDQKAASAQLSLMEQIAKRIGMSKSVSANASAGQTSQFEIVLTGSARSAVGLRPAFVPVTRLEGLTMGAEAWGPARSVTQMEAFESGLPSHKQAMLKWLETKGR